MEGEYRNDLSVLMREAEWSTEARGHDLSWELLTPEELAYGHCVNCGMDVTCKVRPLPNEIETGGSAVALNCPYEHGVDEDVLQWANRPGNEIWRRKISEDFDLSWLFDVDVDGWLERLDV